MPLSVGRPGSGVALTLSCVAFRLPRAALAYLKVDQATQRLGACGFRELDRIRGRIGDQPRTWRPLRRYLPEMPCRFGRHGSDADSRKHGGT